MDKNDGIIRPLICLRDKKSRIWPSPVAYVSEDLAKRELAHAARYGKGLDGNPPLFKDYPDDFELVCVGFFNVVTGEVGSSNHVVCSVADILPKE